MDWLYDIPFTRKGQRLGKNKLALVGMMGSGKTTLGRVLADMLGVVFADVDTLVEAATGMSIPAFFAIHGEAAFRDNEFAVIRDLLVRPEPMVMALGGGAFVQPQVRNQLETRAVSVYIRVPRDELLERLAATDIAERPLLMTRNWREQTLRLATEREPVYNSADFTLNIANERTEDSAKRLMLLANDVFMHGYTDEKTDD